ncbi:MAG: hypothetical protein P8Z73_00675 [Desulfobacteraceae bacterium]
MKVYRTFRAALKGLLRNPMRAMLTTLGIVIGVAAVTRQFRCPINSLCK